VASQTSPSSLLSPSSISNGAHPHRGEAVAKRASGQTAGEVGTRLVGLLRRHTGAQHDDPHIAMLAFYLHERR